MHRSRIIILAVLLAAIGAVVPMAAMFYVSWTLAIRAEQHHLTLFAERAITRANISYSEAKTALQTIAASRLEPCSPEHIALMRKLTAETLSVEEMGYFQNGLLQCTSWGRTEITVRQTPFDFTTPDGIGVTVRVNALISLGRPMMALHYKSYNVLVDPIRFVDIIVDPHIQLALANDKGILLSELNAPDPTLLHAIAAAPRDGMNDKYFFAVARGERWMAIAVEPRAEIEKRLQRQQMLLLPIGVFLAAFIVGIVVWLSRKRLSPLGELSLALHNKEFVVHYQPIIELKTGICVGAEALVRWRRPDGSLIRPDHFIPLAEESGLIMPLTDQVIEAVISDLNRFLVDERSVHIAINLSAEDVRSGRFLPVLQNALEHTGIRPAQIWLEATERGFMDVDSARATIAKARELGYSVAIDDFGTGYSSLQYLQQLPLDALKIDKSFIDTIGMDAATSAVTPHIIDMAKSLNLHIVGEGIATQAQADYLRAHDVGYGQGWFFAQPLPAEEFIIFYKKNKQKYGLGPELIPAPGASSDREGGRAHSSARRGMSDKPEPELPQSASDGQAPFA